MKMCLAPCFKGCTDDDYRTEVGRVQAYFDSGGDSLVREITTQREKASSDLEFESAAALHARVEKLKPLLSQLPEIVHRIDQLTAIMVQRSAVPESVVFFFVDRGLISGPLTFSIQAPEHTKSQSMESRILAALATIPPAEPKSAVEIMEHLALLKRWFYRSTRVGRNFLCGREGWIAFAAIGAWYCACLSRRKTRNSFNTDNLGTAAGFYPRPAKFDVVLRTRRSEGPDRYERKHRSPA